MGIYDKTSKQTSISLADNSNVGVGGEGFAFGKIGRNAVVNMTDGGAFDFATRVNESAAAALSENTRAVLNKITVDSGERVQAIAMPLIYAAAAVAVAFFLFKKG